MDTKRRPTNNDPAHDSRSDWFVGSLSAHFGLLTTDCVPVAVPTGQMAYRLSRSRPRA